MFKSIPMKDRLPHTCTKCGKIEYYGKCEDIDDSTFECSDCVSEWLWSIDTEIK